VDEVDGVVPFPGFSEGQRAGQILFHRRPEPLDRGLELRFWLTASVFSALGTIQARTYRHALKQLELRPPLFLVGHWRSGTTLLHELLCLDARYTYPTTHACMNPHHFVLSEGNTLVITLLRNWLDKYFPVSPRSR